MDDQRLEEMYRLVRENNKMLHAQRRGAFIGGIVKAIVWIAMILVPIWLYMTYLAPLLQTTLNTMQQIQSVGGEAQAQLGGATETLKSLQEKIQNLIPKQ
jgi:hypothetical protein